jgi:hypothetical protein
MPIPIHCPCCGATREVKDKYAGLKVECKSCGEFVRVAGGVDLVEVDVIEEPDEVITEPRREIRVKRKRTSLEGEGYHLGVVVSLFIITLILIFGLSVAIVYGFRSAFGVPSDFAHAPPISSPTIIPPPAPNVGIPRETKPQIDPLTPNNVSVTLSNLRPVTNAPGRGLEVDFVFTSGEARPGELYFLKMRNANGTRETPYTYVQLKNQGTLRVELFGTPRKTGGGRIEVWLERQDFRNPRDRDKISNTVSLE